MIQDLEGRLKDESISVFAQEFAVSYAYLQEEASYHNLDCGYE